MKATGSTPTKSQNKAVVTLDRHVVVTAGPGSGKTRVLINRYLHIIETGLADIENIVAITFTNKAANEMRERLREEIDQRIVKYHRTPAENIWRDRKRRLEGAAITTIHGFCSLILREHPVEAGIDPQFVTLDEYSSLVIIRKAAEEAVMQLTKDGGEQEAKLIMAYTRRNTLIQYLVNAYCQIRGLGITLDEAAKITKDALLSSDNYDESVALLRRVIGELTTATGLTTNGQDQVRRFLAAWDIVRADIEDGPNQVHLSDFICAIEQLRSTSPEKRGKVLSPIVESLRPIIGHKTEAPVGSLQAAFYDNCASPYLSILLDLLGRIDSQATSDKRDVASLDYDDLQLKTRELLKDHSEVRRQLRQRYTFFLVDEFQDTNGLQRDIISLLAGDDQRPNLFVVGDRKQSVYGFRGAEVEIFKETIEQLAQKGGEIIPLRENFRSDPRLVEFFNEFFSNLMKKESFEDEATNQELGFVEYEMGEAVRLPITENIAVELMLDLPFGDQARQTFESTSDSLEETAEREARRVVERIRAIVEGAQQCVIERQDIDAKGTARQARYGDIAILFRSMTNVKYYERALQQAGVPYYVVAGRGFYDRPEINDLLNLLSFLDNRTDEIALAGILRSPLFGISDDTLLALRIGQPSDHSQLEGSFNAARKSLFTALQEHGLNDYISDTEHNLLAEAVNILNSLIAQRNRLPISGLLSKALRLTDYEVVAAAARDGAQRLSNIDKLIAVAQQFERGGMRLLRDFIQYVREFRRFEAREAEALLQTDNDSVALLTVHKSKGLEFPIVVLPDSNRRFIDRIDPIAFDRYLGLGFNIPDGQGGLLQTGLHLKIAKNRQLRERFEAMRLFYVAATRAEDLLIISGASKTGLKISNTSFIDCKSWLHWLLRVLNIETADGDTIKEWGKACARVVGGDIRFQCQTNGLENTTVQQGASDRKMKSAEADVPTAINRILSLLKPVPSSETGALKRFSATALQGFNNCPRQFYYANRLRLSDLAYDDGSRNPAELSEPGRLPADLRGLVIHRFCETYQANDHLEDRLLLCLRDIQNRRGDAYSEIFASLDWDEAVRDVIGLAENYINSPMYTRIAGRQIAGKFLPNGQHVFVRSEQQFILRMKQALIFGTIDKLLLTPTNNNTLSVHIIDFKTSKLNRTPAEFSAAVEKQAVQYQTQMQIYSEAVRRMIPNVSEVKATLQFLQPKPALEYEYSMSAICEIAASNRIEELLNSIASRGSKPTNYEAISQEQCLRCRFNELCPEGSIYTIQGYHLS